MESFFRHCKHCGAGFFKNFSTIEFFCQDCWLKLESQRAPRNFKIYKTEKIIIHPHYIWRNDEDIVRDLVSGLKGGTPYLVLERLCNSLCKLKKPDQDSLIIPVPSSKVGEKDHAYLMADLISKKLGLEFFPCLEWAKKGTSQKFLNKNDRFNIEMKSTRKLPGKKGVILVDDVVTTGATAGAALKAFKGLNQIQVWSLACRI